MKDAVVYVYDGSFAGLLCCVFASYSNKEIPAAIESAAMAQPSLLMQRHIETDKIKARRVLKSIPLKISTEALNLITKGFLTCLPQKELTILFFLRLGYKYGAKICRLLTNDTVHKLLTAVRAMENESHLLKGFIRFTDRSGVLVSIIEPKNFVLPLLSRHFAERYPAEKFMIYDTTHNFALVYQAEKLSIIPIETIKMRDLSEDELKYQELWRIFHKTIAIQERYNPQCQNTLLPKRYRHCMTEFTDAPAELLKQLL